MMIDKIKLPFQFDAERMKKELEIFAPEDWIAHFNHDVYSGEWSAIPLRSVGGDTQNISPDATKKGVYTDTPYMNQCPYIKEVVDTLECEKIDVRLLKLKAGSHIKEHRDYGLAFENGEVRIHVPVATNPLLEFYFNRERVHLAEGECWYLNFNLLHSVNNLSPTDRIHLVIDCKTNEWLSDLFHAGMRQV